MKKVLPWLAVTAVVAAAGLFVSSESWAAEDEAAPASLVEDYTHPGAEAILAEYGLKVFKGDGHIMFTASYKFDENRQCAAGEIQVEKLIEVDPYGVYYCFKTVGTQGFLTLEVPGTFGVRGGSRAIQATADLPEGEKTYQISPNSYVAISPGSGSDLPEAILVELRMTGA